MDTSLTLGRGLEMAIPYNTRQMVLYTAAVLHSSSMITDEGLFAMWYRPRYEQGGQRGPRRRRIRDVAQGRDDVRNGLLLLLRAELFIRKDTSPGSPMQQAWKIYLRRPDPSQSKSPGKSGPYPSQPTSSQPYSP